MKARHILFLLILVSLAFSFTACKKKAPAPMEPTTTAPPSEPSEPPPLVERPTEGGGMEAEIYEACTRQLQPVLYDYNRYDIREDQIPSLQNNARVLKAGECGTVTVLIEGHCDERGTDEYNLALGERRADAAKDFLVSLGIPEARLNTISYGESRPFAQGHNEDAWQQNRRAHFVAVRK